MSTLVRGLFSIIASFIGWSILEAIVTKISEVAFSREVGEPVIKGPNITLIEIVEFGDESFKRFQIKDKRWFLDIISKRVEGEDITFYKSFVGTSDYYGVAKHIRILIFATRGDESFFRSEVSKHSGFILLARTKMNDAISLADFEILDEEQDLIKDLGGIGDE